MPVIPDKGLVGRCSHIAVEADTTEAAEAVTESAPTGEPAAAADAPPVEEEPFVTPADTATWMDHEATAELAIDVDDAHEEATHWSETAGAPARLPGQRHRPAPAGVGSNLKAVVAPILITVGLLVLAPAVWGLLVLMGVEVFASGRDSANTMAKVMLICWPMGTALIVAGIVCLVQVQKQKSRNR